LLLQAFDRWNGDWARLLASGNLLTASASLMANALYAFRTKEDSESFLNSISGLIATLVIAFSCLFYAGLVLVNQQILPSDVHMSPKAVISSSVILYLSARFVTYRVLVVQHKKLPSNPEVRDEQVRSLEEEFERTHE
jgi:heme/copper-type cytochrome/quinol oxidase subunit 3